MSLRYLPKRVAFLDPTGHALAALRDAFAEICHKADTLQLFATKQQLQQELEQHDVDLVVIDYVLGDGASDGLAMLHDLQASWPAVLVLMVAETGDIDMATRSIHAGATDFLVRHHRLPERVATQLQKLRHLLRLIEQNRKLDQTVQGLRAQEQARHAIVGASPQIQQVREQIKRIAGIPRPVLITGERGTGKELVARAIHNQARPHRPFVIVNCAAFPDALLETELFGHEEGAFTGAQQTARGKFEQAHGGSLFLDEIGHMSLAFQTKILRVAEYGTFSRIGGSTELQADVHLITATNADLRDAIQQGRFLADLYDRLAFEEIEVPPLRTRRGDIPILAAYFLEEFIQEVPAFHGRQLSPQSLELLASYHFPGNVRELKHIIERAVCRDTSAELTPRDLGLQPHQPLPTQSPPEPPQTPPAEPQLRGYQEKMDAYAKQLLAEALADADGNQAEAARKLGLSYHQFRYYHRKYFPK